MNTGIETMLATPGQQQQQQQQQPKLQSQPQEQEQLQVQQIQQQMDPLTQSTAETWLSIASLAETLGDADRAAMAYDATLQYNQSSTKALTSLAHLYRSRDMFQKAAELYERALAVNPELSDVWATLGHCYLMLDDLQRAYNAYQQALYHLSNPNVPKLWHGIGILYDRYGSLDYAEEAFAKVLELDPHFEKANEIYFRLGIIYKHQGKWNQALECFRYILPQPPAPLQEWDIRFQLGSVLENMGEWQGAREAYEHVLLQNEHHAKVLQQLGCLYGMNNVQFYDPQKALNFLLKSLESDPSDATTWYHLGRVHMIRSDYTAAYDAFQQAVNRDSRNPIFWCSIGVLYYQISQYRDALDAYTRAIRLNPYISEVWYDLGTLYETCNNQLTDALDAYKQAARLDPENIHIRERLEALTQQLANNSNSNSNNHVMNKNGQVANADGTPNQDGQSIQPSSAPPPPPIMLQPTLQSNDQSNPLNIRPPATTLYANGPLGQQQVQQVQQTQQQQQMRAHMLAQTQPQLQQYAMAVPQQSPPTMLPPPPPQQNQSHLQMKTLSNVGQDNPSYPHTQPMFHQPIIQVNQPSLIGNADKSNTMGPMIPQKRHMDGSIHTLVNAAVSSVNDNPNSAPPSAAPQVPTLLASQKNTSTLVEPQQKKLKTKKSPKATIANLKIRSTTVKDKEKEKEREKPTSAKQQQKSINSNGNEPSTKSVQERKSDDIPGEANKTNTADSAATITAPASANASVAVGSEVASGLETKDKDKSEQNPNVSAPTAGDEPSRAEFPKVPEKSTAESMATTEAREAVKNATVEAVEEAKEANAVQKTAELESMTPTGLPPVEDQGKPIENNAGELDAERLSEKADNPPAPSTSPNAATGTASDSTTTASDSPPHDKQESVGALSEDKALTPATADVEQGPESHVDDSDNVSVAKAIDTPAIPAPSTNTVEAAIEDIKDTEKTIAEPETVIKPSAEAMEKLQEEAKLREEEEKERLEERNSNSEQSGNSNVVRENVVRQIEEDENYDD